MPVVTMTYDAEELRSVARQLREVADRAQSLALIVGAIAPTEGLFGAVPAATGFSSASLAARDVQTRGAVREADRRTAMGVDADQGADFAEALTAITENEARSAAPGSIDEIGPVGPVR